MAEIVLMPLMSDTMTEGVVAEWHKKIGDTVESGDLLAEIETDKATMEFEAPESGILVYHSPLGEPIPINDVLAIIAEEGEEVNVEALLKEHGKVASSSKPAPQPEAEKVTKTEPTKPTVPTTEKLVAPPAANHDGRIKASPLAKSLARQHNINLQNIVGTGSNGRIIKRDIEAYLSQNAPQKEVSPAPQTSTPPAPQLQTNVSSPTRPNRCAEAFDEVRVSQMRKTIARRLGESKFGGASFLPYHKH